MSRNSENVISLDLIPRHLLDFLPAKTWVGELRLRSTFNLTSGHKLLKVRPKLTYFHFKNGAPFVNLYIQSELYFPHNNSNRTISETWYYLGTLFHLTDWFKIGPYYAFWERHWYSTEGFANEWSRSYEIKQSAHLIGLSTNFYL